MLRFLLLLLIIPSAWAKPLVGCGYLVVRVINQSETQCSLATMPKPYSGSIKTLPDHQELPPGDTHTIVLEQGDWVSGAETWLDYRCGGEKLTFYSGMGHCDFLENGGVYFYTENQGQLRAVPTGYYYSNYNEDIPGQMTWVIRP